MEDVAVMEEMLVEVVMVTAISLKYRTLAARAEAMQVKSLFSLSCDIVTIEEAKE